MRLLYLAPKGGDVLAPHLVDEFDYVAMVGDAIPEPFPGSMVFQRWRPSHRIYDLVSVHRPDAILVLLLWQEAPWMPEVLKEIGRLGTPFLVLKAAGVEAPVEGNVLTLQCLPSKTGDDPLSVSLAAGKVFLPDSVAERELGCPDLGEVATQIKEFFQSGNLPDSPNVTLKSLKEYLQEEGVEVKVIPGSWPPHLAAAAAKLSGAVYWAPQVWERYFTQVVEP